MRTEDLDAPNRFPDGRGPESQPRWRRDFPVDFSSDEFRSRREFTGLLLLTSLAFAVGQVWIVALRALRSDVATLPILDIGGVDDLPRGAVKEFAYPTAADPCVLARLSDGRFVAYDRRCTHLSCPVVANAEASRLDCPCHNGHFDLATGVPVAGPPRRPLPRVELTVRAGRVLATGIALEGSRWAGRP